MNISIDYSKSKGRLEHFWQGTGFTPAKLLLDKDMRQYLTYIGSIPHGGITHVRIHYLLDLVRADKLGTDCPNYNWTLLDLGLDLLIENNLKPFFELMGNPSGYFSDFNDDGQLHVWKRMIRDLALHLMQRYGREEVETWYFETWNEPDARWWHQWPHDTVSFCNYYDACSEGLKEANPNLRLGGPGSCRTLSEIFKAFVAHCDCGTNYFTGEKGVRLDFISVHEKGARPNPEDITPNLQAICDRELLAYKYVCENHPRLADVPFMNNECDIQVGWVDIHTWRAKPYYAANVCKVIDQHIKTIIDGSNCNYLFLSNDNGFIGTWGQRTHLTRFGEEVGVDPNRAQLRPRIEEFELIKKPVHNVMVMLSMLGSERLIVESSEECPDIGVIATKRDDNQLAVLVYHSRDQIETTDCKHITLQLTGLPFTDAALVHYRIDESHTNPFRIWEMLGAPLRPSAEDFALMREHQELTAIAGPSSAAIDSGSMSLDFDLPLPGVSLILISQKPPEGPGKVHGLRAERYRSLTHMDEIMLTWKHVDSRFIKTYEVLYSETADGRFERVNKTDLLCSAFLHVKPHTGGREGFYKVRAVDYWGRAGEASEIIKC